MRIHSLTALVVLLVLASVSAHADNIFKIEVGSSSDVSKADLERRVYELERAVLQLQQKVFALEMGADNARSDMTTCYLKTPFDGTFTTTAPTETAARAGALKKCSDAGVSSTFCDESKIKCGK